MEEPFYGGSDMGVRGGHEATISPPSWMRYVLKFGGPNFLRGEGCNDPDPDSPLGPTLDPLETYD